MIIEHIIRIFAPHYCLGCHKEGSLLCSACLSGLEKPQPVCVFCKKQTNQTRMCSVCAQKNSLVFLEGATQYTGLAKELVSKAKFDRAQAAMHDMAAVVAPLISNDVLARNPIICHIPTADARVRQRGYDQARLLARAVAQRARIPHVPLLIRQGSRRQVGASVHERRIQMEHAYRVHSTIVPQTPVILIDDVITTGSTILSAADALRAVGAGPIYVLAFAIATPPKQP